MSRKNVYILVAAVIIIAAIWVEAETHSAQKWISSVVYDNRVHSLSCDELPPLSEVEQSLEEHQNTIQIIENIDPEFIWIHIDSSCPGKGSLVIEYPSHADRLKIEEILGDTFFGIPYKGINY